MCSDAAWTGVDVVGVLVAGVTGRGILELVLWPDITICVFLSQGGVPAGSASYSSCSDLTSSSIFSWGVFGLSGLSIRVSSSCQDLDCRMFWKIFFHGFFCHGFHYTHCIVSYITDYAIYLCSIYCLGEKKVYYERR